MQIPREEPGTILPTRLCVIFWRISGKRPRAAPSCELLFFMLQNKRLNVTRLGLIVHNSKSDRKISIFSFRCFFSAASCPKVKYVNAP